MGAEKQEGNKDILTEMVNSERKNFILHKYSSKVKEMMTSSK
jgi:hypothetical protein